MRRRCLVVAVYTFLSGIGVARCRTATSPDEAVPEWIRAEWTAAQRELAQLQPPVRLTPYAVGPERFRFKEEPAGFWCGTVAAVGCFESPRTIRYHRDHRYVVKHEAGHAILFTLHDSRWRCWQHPEPCEP